MPWEEQEAFCRDEQLSLAAVDASGDVYDTIPYRATEWVFSALSERWGGEMIRCGFREQDRPLLVIQDFDNTVAKVGISRDKLLDATHAFIDRHGTYRAPYSVAEQLASAFCRQFPDEILDYVEVRDANYLLSEVEADPERSDDNIYMRYLRQQRSAIRLVREWCGHEAVARFNEVTILRQENDRLRGIIESLARWLEKEGYHKEAPWLLKQMNNEGTDDS